MMEKDKINLASDFCAKTGFIVTTNFGTDKLSDEFRKQKKYLEELPVNREIPIKKRNKAQTSRKASAGKIVSQHHMLNQAE